MMAKKDWVLKGEVSAKQRPKNSLLENYLDFQVTLKNPPIPTQELTDKIESIIIQRIKDEMFDNPARKKTININKSKIELNFAKSKEGLGQLYENDFNGDEAQERSGEKINTKEEDVKIKTEIDLHMEELFNTLDKLSSFYFIPRESNKNLNITNIGTITLEDISYATNVINQKDNKAPSEIYNKKDTKLVTKDDMLKNEKQTSHNKWKRNIRSRIRSKENIKKMEKLSANYNSKFETKMAIKQSRDKQNYKYNMSKEQKSGNFFSNIQNIAEADVRGKVKEQKDGKRIKN